MPLFKKQSGRENEDTLLLKHWYEGNEAAFNKLYHKYYKQAIIYCLSLCKDRNKSKEITQNTFIKIVNKVSEQKGKRIEDFPKYLFGALKTNWLEYSRNQQRQNSRFTEVDDYSLNKAADSDGVDAFMTEELKQRILELLSDLDASIYEKHLEGYNYTEIAHELNLTEGQVRGRVFRAKDIIRKNKNDILDMINGTS